MRRPCETSGMWYREGIRFECTSCGRCCEGGTGYVWVTVEEARTIAARLSLPLDELGRRFLRRIGDRYALLDRPVTGDCVMLEGGRCTIYQDRPAQCRSFPFWPKHLESPQAWAAAERECEGISVGSPIVPFEEIGRLRLGG